MGAVKIGNTRRSIAGRRRKAINRARAQGADAFLITRGADVGYLCGFTGDDSFLLLRSGAEAVLITDGRYAEQAGRECQDLRVFVRTGPMAGAVAEALGDAGGAVAVQGDHITVAGRDRLAKVLGARRILAVADLVGELRMTKDDDEVRAIRRAVRVAERAWKEFVAEGRRAFVGRSEREVAAELDYRMRLAGADGPSFETIVAAGANSSRPHYRPADVRIGADQPVLIDWGARVGGYVSDLTRVVFAGRIPPKLAEAYQVVREANRAGVEAVRAGASRAAPDLAARKVIDDAGFGGQFLHGLGHGIGRQVHESPALSRRSKGRLRSGMVVTVEPGIYLPGVGGIRIEDDVLVTVDGRRRLTTLPRSLQAMELR